MPQSKSEKKIRMRLTVNKETGAIELAAILDSGEYTLTFVGALHKHMLAVTEKAFEIAEAQGIGTRQEREVAPTSTERGSRAEKYSEAGWKMKPVDGCPCGSKNIVSQKEGLEARRHFCLDCESESIADLSSGRLVWVDPAKMTRFKFLIIGTGSFGKHSRDALVAKVLKECPNAEITLAEDYLGGKEFDSVVLDNAHYVTQRLSNTLFGRSLQQLMPKVPTTK